MSVRVLTSKEIIGLEDQLRMAENIATKQQKKPRILTNAQTITNLNIALDLASITLNTSLIEVPPTTVTLTPAYPTSSDGNNWLMFRTQGGGLVHYHGDTGMHV